MNIFTLAKRRIALTLLIAIAPTASLAFLVWYFSGDIPRETCDPSRDPECTVEAGSTEIPPTKNRSPAPASIQAATPNPIPLGAEELCSYVVATDGSNDETGSVTDPFRTIQAGIERLQPGDRLCVRGGFYTETLTIDAAGTSDQPITIMAYPGEHPVIDGQAGKRGLNTGYPLCANGCRESDLAEVDPVSGKGHVWEALVTISGEHVVFTGFDVQKSMGRGLILTDALNVTIKNINVHHSRHGGILAFTDAHQITIEGCTVWWNGEFASYSRSPALDWPVILMVRGTDVAVRNNAVFNNWGEGIGAGRGSKAVLIESNTIYDNYALQIYVDHGQDVTISSNLVYFSEDQTFFRGGAPPECIAINNEIGFSGHLNENIRIVNNLVRGCRYNLGLWAQASLNGVKDLLVAHNTFVDGTEGAILIAPALVTPHKDVRIKNNLIIQSSGIPVDLGTRTGILFSNNLWWPLLPAEQATSEGDVYADPELSLRGSIAAGELLPDYFTFKSADSPAIDAALVDEDAIEADYFDLPRGLSPDIGAVEWGE